LDAALPKKESVGNEIWKFSILLSNICYK